MKILDKSKIAENQAFAFYNGNGYSIQIKDGFYAKTVYHCSTVWSILKWVDENGLDLIDRSKWESYNGKC